MKWNAIATSIVFGLTLPILGLASTNFSPTLAQSTPLSVSSLHQVAESIVIANNSQTLTARIKKLMTDNTDGVVGLYLKRVNGPVLASSASQTPFYPASTIKVLEHLHSMRAVEAGTVNLNTTMVKVYPKAADSCSNNHTGQSFNKETLKTTLDKMMNNSNNQSTNAIQELFGNGNAAVGRNAINQTAHNIVGMSNNSAINHKFGCGGPNNNPANSLTLQDLGKLYEKVSTGLLSNANRNTFYNLMLNGQGNITTVIDEEAAKLGLNAGTVQSFKKQVKTAAKAGSYSINGIKYASIGGWVSLPFKKNGVVKNQEYVFGLFVDKATKINDNFGVSSTRAELLRDEIRTALTTFK